MMRVRFNKFERVAGLFVLVAVVGFLFSMLSVAIKQGWFETKIYLTTTFENADGIHPGTSVQMAGLKAGSVESVDLTHDNKILVRFYLLSKFHPKVKKDSQAQLTRPFIIGERVLEVTVGSEKENQVLPESSIASYETMDLMTVMSGKKLGNYLETMSTMVENLKTLAEAFLDKNRTQAFINMFDRVDPLLKNLNAMSVEVIKLSKQASKDENLGIVLSQLTTTTKELNKIIPDINDKAPNLAKDLATVVSNLSVLTEQFKVFIPAIAEVAPDLPRSSRRALEALDEAVILLKAMEKSFLVRGNVQEVREEEAKQPRKPAGK